MTHQVIPPKDPIELIRLAKFLMDRWIRDGIAPNWDGEKQLLDKMVGIDQVGILLDEIDRLRAQLAANFTS